MNKTSALLLLLAFIFSNTCYAGPSAEADVSLTPAGDFKAKTSDISGHASVKGDMVIAQNVIVNMKSLTTGISLRDKHAREKYLEVEKYPQMVLVKAIGKGGKGKGRIKYRGEQKDVAGTYSIKGDMIRATFPIKLSDFKIDGIKYMGIGVDDNVKITVNLPIKK